MTRSDSSSRYSDANAASGDVAKPAVVAACRFASADPRFRCNTRTPWWFRALKTSLSAVALGRTFVGIRCLRRLRSSPPAVRPRLSGVPTARGRCVTCESGERYAVSILTCGWESDGLHPRRNAESLVQRSSSIDFDDSLDARPRTAKWPASDRPFTSTFAFLRRLWRAASA